MDKPIGMVQKFKVSEVTSGWMGGLGGCLVIQCQNEEHRLTIWYNPNGDTSTDKGWLVVESGVVDE
jgi:hypothetical protein